MALLLTQRTGDRFKVGGTDVLVEAIVNKKEAILTVRGLRFRVRDDRSEEILPGVFVSVGREAHEGSIRLAIEAPRKVRVERQTAA